MSSIPLPALDIRTPQPNDALGSFQKLMALRSLANQQQLQQQQIQSGQQEQQIRQQQIQDMQATTAAFKSWDPKSQSYDDLAQGVIKNGGSANAAMQVTQHGLQMQQGIQTLTKDQRENFIAAHKQVGDALEPLADSKLVPDDQLHTKAAATVTALAQAGVMDGATAQQSLQKIQATSDPVQLRALIDQVAKTSMGASTIAAQTKTAAETFEAQQKGEEAKTGSLLNQNKLDIINSWKQNPQQVLSQVDSIVPPNGSQAALNARTKSQVQFALSNGDVEGAKAAMKQAAEQVGAIEKEINPQVVQTKEAIAATEAKTSQLIKGMAEPGYAFNPKTGQTQLTDKTSYLQSGGQLQAFRPIGEKDVRDDTNLTNRLGDVHQKLAEYQQALTEPVSDKDKGNMAALLGTHGFKLGAFGTEIPMDRVNNALQEENLKGLSANARDQLVAYRNMREALVGYKTVLSGSSRGSDKQMELLDQAIPIPSLTDKDYSQRSINAFRGNLRVVGQGLPTLPGIKNPQEIEAEVWGNKPAGSTAPPATNTPQKATKASKYGTEFK